MKKELSISIILFTILMIGFVFSVKITEERNNSYLIQKYTYSKDIKENNTGIISPITNKAIEYQQKKVIVWVTGIVLGMLIPLVFLFSGLSAGIRNWAQDKSKHVIIVVILYFILYFLINALISLPLDYYSGFILKHQFGLSNQTVSKWFGDFFKNLVISVGAGSLFIFVPYMLIKKFPTYWWLHLGLILIPILFFITLISPLYIDPLFNKYEEVQNTNLESKIYKEIDRTGISNCEVYQVNKSVDTKEMNAYMTGVLNTKRIVLWDTTIKNLSEEETLCVVAHEMGHYIMGHVWKSILFGGAFAILMLYLISKSAIWIIEKSGGIFGFDKLYDIASLPLLILLINIFVFAATPAVNAYSRYTEREADRFELELTKDNQASLTSTIKLHEKSLMLPTPGEVYKLWNYTHPTYEERVEFAKDYEPWKENKPLKYQKYIKY